MTTYSLQGKRVWVAGHRGMAGSAIARRLERENCTILTVDRGTLDLRRQSDVEAWMGDNRIDSVFVAAATVGGIMANSTRPAEFLYDNMTIASNIIHGAYTTKIRKLLFLASSCIYPRLAPQPMREDSLLTGPLEPTNEWYAIAKIAGIKMCQAYRRQYGCDYIAVIPTNLYGYGDKYDLAGGHVVAAMIMKVHAAKMEQKPTIELWGSGAPKREFMFADDMADACLYLMKDYSSEDVINIGTGDEVSIFELAQLVAKVVGWQGTFTLDTYKPDGAPRKAMDSTRLHAMGWRATTGLEDGLRRAYQWYVENAA